MSVFPFGSGYSNRSSPTLQWRPSPLPRDPGRCQTRLKLSPRMMTSALIPSPSRWRVALNRTRQHPDVGGVCRDECDELLEPDIFDRQIRDEEIDGLDRHCPINGRFDQCQPWAKRSTVPGLTCSKVLRVHVIAEHGIRHRCIDEVEPVPAGDAEDSNGVGLMIFELFTGDSPEGLQLTDVDRSYRFVDLKIDLSPRMPLLLTSRTAAESRCSTLHHDGAEKRIHPVRPVHARDTCGGSSRWTPLSDLD